MRDISLATVRLWQRRYNRSAGTQLLLHGTETLVPGASGRWYLLQTDLSARDLYAYTKELQHENNPRNP